MHNRGQKLRCSRTVRRWWSAVVLLTIASVASLVSSSGCAAPDSALQTNVRSTENADMHNPVNSIPSTETNGFNAVPEGETARVRRLEEESRDLQQKYTALQEKYNASENRISELEKQIRSAGASTEPSGRNTGLGASESDRPKGDASTKAVEFIDYRIRYDRAWGLLGGIEAYFQFRNNSNKTLTGVVYRVDYYDDFGDTLYTTEPLKHPMRVPPGEKNELESHAWRYSGSSLSSSAFDKLEAAAKAGIIKVRVRILRASYSDGSVVDF